MCLSRSSSYPEKLTEISTYRQTKNSGHLQHRGGGSSLGSRASFSVFGYKVETSFMFWSYRLFGCSFLCFYVSFSSLEHMGILLPQLLGTGITGNGLSHAASCMVLTKAIPANSSPEAVSPTNLVMLLLLLLIGKQAFLRSSVCVSMTENFSDFSLFIDGL